MSDAGGEVHLTIDVPVVGRLNGAGHGAPLSHGYVDVRGERAAVRVSLSENRRSLEVAVRAPGDERATIYDVSLAWLMRRLVFAHVSRDRPAP